MQNVEKVNKSFAKTIVRKVRRIISELEMILARMSSSDEEFDPILRSRIEEGVEAAHEILEESVRKDD